MDSLYFSDLELQRYLELGLDKERALWAYFGSHKKPNGKLHVRNCDEEKLGYELSYFLDYGIYFDGNKEAAKDKPVSKHIVVLKSYDISYKEIVERNGGVEPHYIFSLDDTYLLEFINSVDVKTRSKILNIIEINSENITGDIYEELINPELREDKFQKLERHLEYVSGLSSPYIVEHLSGMPKRKMTNIGVMVAGMVKYKKTPFFRSFQDGRNFINEFQVYRKGRYLLFEEVLETIKKHPTHTLMYIPTRSKWYHIINHPTDELTMEIQVRAVEFNKKEIVGEYKVELVDVHHTKVLSVREFCNEHPEDYERILSENIALLEEMVGAEQIIPLNQIVLFKNEGKDMIGQLREFRAEKEVWVIEDLESEPIKTKVDLMSQSFMPVYTMYDFSKEWAGNFYKTIYKKNSKAIPKTFVYDFHSVDMNRYLYHAMGFYGLELFECDKLDYFDKNLSYRRDTYIIEFSRRLKKVLKTFSGARVPGESRQLLDIFGNLKSEGGYIPLEHTHFGAISIVEKRGVDIYE